MKSYIISHLSDSMLKLLNVVDFQLFLDPFSFFFFCCYLLIGNNIFSYQEIYFVQSIWSHTLHGFYSDPHIACEIRSITWNKRNSQELLPVAVFRYSGNCSSSSSNTTSILSHIMLLGPLLKHKWCIQLVKLIGFTFYVKL